MYEVHHSIQSLRILNMLPLLSFKINLITRSSSEYVKERKKLIILVTVPWINWRELYLLTYLAGRSPWLATRDSLCLHSLMLKVACGYKINQSWFNGLRNWLIKFRSSLFDIIRKWIRWMGCWQFNLNVLRLVWKSIWVLDQFVFLLDYQMNYR